MQLEALSDEQLMERYRKGEVRAFELLLERHGKAVFNFILRYHGDVTTAEDLTQEVFLRVVRGASQFERRSSFRTWVFSIARNICVDWLRRQRHRRMASLDQPLGDDPDAGKLLDTVADEAPLEDRRAMDQQFTEELGKALETLNPDQREVFVLRELRGLSFAEIAEVVDCPVNTVKSRMRYALESLRVSLAPFREAASGVTVAAERGS